MEEQKKQEQESHSLTAEFVPYELAAKLKELGFDEPCIATHGYLELYINTDDGHLKAPLFQQAFRWFREKYGLDSFCRQTNLDGRSYYKISRIETDEIIKGYSNFTKTYEEAELACLTKLIEIVESKSE